MRKLGVANNHVFVVSAGISPQRQRMDIRTTAARHAAGLIAAAAASFSLGVVTPAARIAYDSGVTATTLVAFRVAVATVVTAALVLSLRRSLAFTSLAKVPAMTTTAGMLMVAFGYMSSVLFIPVSLAALIFFLFPIIVLVHGVIVARRPPSMATVAAFVAAFTGLAMALGPSFETLDWRGIACALVAAVGATLVMIAGATAARRMDAFALTFYTQAISLPVVLAALFSVGTVALPGDQVGWIGLAVATTGYIAGMVLLMVAVRLANPAPVSMINNLEPLVTLTVAAVLLGERLATVQYMGGGLVLAAVFLAAREMAAE